jgi:predicted ATP-dependent endonuclease of OLD family
MFKKNEMTIAEIHEELRQLGYGIKLEVLAQMTTRELKKFRKDVIKASALVNDLDLRVTEYEGRLKGLSDED